MNEGKVKKIKLVNFMLGNHDIKVIKLFTNPYPTYNFDIFQSRRYQGTVEQILGYILILPLLKIFDLSRKLNKFLG